MDGYLQDWYQPVHESGNVLSYPWSRTQLALQFSDQVAPLTHQATCMANDQSQQTANTTWNQGATGSHSSGSSSSFSDELSMSYSEGIGVSGVDSANVNFSTNVGAYTSLNTLNESTSSLSSSQGITITKPDFGYTSLCCTYGFGQYIFGLQGKTHHPAEDACKAGKTSGCVPVNDPDGHPIGVAGTGPLFTGYAASPLNNAPRQHRTDLFRKSALVGRRLQSARCRLNHPERWFWDGNAQSVQLKYARPHLPRQKQHGPRGPTVLYDEGLFINKKDSENTSLSLSPAPLNSRS